MMVVNVIHPNGDEIVYYWKAETTTLDLFEKLSGSLSIEILAYQPD